MIGSYHLLVKFGEVVVPLSTSMLRELTIIQDLNKLLPEFRFRFDDASGLATHIAPFDKNMNRVSIECAKDYDTDDKNIFEFKVYVREPKGGQSTPTAEYDISGLLDVDGLFVPSYSRAHTGTIKSSLETLATGELGVDETDVGVPLAYEKTLLQPTWNNAQFLNYLENYLRGDNGEYGYKCFIKTYKNKKIFVFKSLSQMIQDQVSYKFILNDTPYEDQLPIYEYYIFDNYNLFGAFGMRTQSFSYFDYATSTYTTETENLDDYLSLSDFFMIDKNDTTGNNEISDNGRSNDLTTNFLGRAKAEYGNRLISLAKMWITTESLPNAVPGQTVQVFFPHGATGDDLYSYQYSGYWLVERVVHNFGDAFVTKLLLTRHGLDTDKDTTLIPASKKKKK